MTATGWVSYVIACAGALYLCRSGDPRDSIHSNYCNFVTGMPPHSFLSILVCGLDAQLHIEIWWMPMDTAPLAATSAQN